jgi:hypothetical protein
VTKPAMPDRILVLGAGGIGGYFGGRLAESDAGMRHRRGVLCGRTRARHLCGVDTKLNLAIRISRIFRRVSDRWRQMHHHGLIGDPQPLSAYQQAVR